MGKSWLIVERDETLRDLRWCLICSRRGTQREKCSRYVFTEAEDEREWIRFDIYLLSTYQYCLEDQVCTTNNMLPRHASVLCI